MKKTVFTIGVLATALLMVACQKANLNDGEKTYVSKIGITIADEADTKTSLDMDTKKLSWVSGDQIRVFGFKDNQMWKIRNLFTVDPSSISVDGHSADFTYTGSVDWSGAGKIAAVYGPYGTSKTSPGFLITSTLGAKANYVQLWYPRNQTYQAGGPNTTYLYMRADLTTDHDHLSFRNMTSVVKLPICDKGVSPITLKSIKLQCNNDPIGGRWYGYTPATTEAGGTADNDYNVSSSWSATYDNYKTYPGLDEVDGSYGNVTSLTSINEDLTNADQYFYIVVAPGAHGQLTVTLTDSYDNTKSWTIASFTSVVGKVYKFPEIDWSAK